MVDDNHKNPGHILLADDEPLVRNSLRELFVLEGYTVSIAANGKEAVELLDKYSFDIVVTDMKMPEMGGLELLKHVRENYCDIPVILITSFGSIENAVEAMKEGAYDYIIKPIIDDELKLVITRLMKEKLLKQENIRLKNELASQHKERFYNIVGKSEKMQKVYSLIDCITNTRATVLISGESGTGKHLVAHAIHEYNAQERDKPFVEVSCGALTETLLESELFGHVKGAFTGAIKDRMGRFELADGGSIFLDEIDAFSPNLQVKLLRVLQEGELERVGDTKTVKVDVRVIAATNHNLLDLIEQGKFRKDLYYRLNIISVKVPSLRERKEDIPLLVNDFIEKHSKHLNRNIEGCSEEALSLLMSYDFPGNVRELENVIERAVILSKGKMILPDDLPEHFNDLKELANVTVDCGCNGLKLKSALMNPEKDLIVKALDSVVWNRNKAAEVLGINRTTLYKKMMKLGLLKK